MTMLATYFHVSGVNTAAIASAHASLTAGAVTPVSGQ
jgi:hypothetical protein